MDIKEGKEILLKRSNAFHERYFRAYGQMMLRVDDKTYLMSRNNLRLTTLKESDIDLYDINTGDIGQIFRSRPDVNAMVFICTEASVFFSQSHSVMKPALDDLAQIIGPDVPVLDSSSAPEILRALKSRHGCFIKGSGIFSIGKDIEEAIAGARILEKSAECELYAHKVHGLKYLSPEQAQRLSDFYDRTYSKVNKSGTVDFVSSGPEEFQMRNEIIEVGKRMAWEDLVQGTWGNISMRLNDHEMLITPSGMDYFNIRIEDIVRVDLNTLEYGLQRTPSSECRLHAGIYRSDPNCNAILHTHSNGISVFAAAHAGFRISDPEMHAVIGDLHCSEYQMPGTDELTASVMEALSGSHACIIANHGALFCSHDIRIALAIAGACETRACNLLGFNSMINSGSETAGPAAVRVLSQESDILTRATIEVPRIQ